MALDRQSIEKKDFPIARRGYDPEAVDAHLERLAVEVDRLQREASGAAGGGPAASSPAPSSPASIAIAASESVRAIVEAAESSAAGIEASARDEAARIRLEAQDDARATRDEAVAKSEGHVGAVGEAASLMLQRVDAMESEIGALVESLRTGANRLGADLSLLQGNMGELYDTAGAGSASGPDDAVGTISVPLDSPSAAPSLQDDEVRSLPPIPEEAPDPSPHEEAPIVPPGLFEATEPAGGPEQVYDEPGSETLVSGADEVEAIAADPPPSSRDDATAPGGGDGDVDGARLIALNMALNGASREETDAYLRDNFDLPDRGALVQEAFATVEG